MIRKRGQGSAVSKTSKVIMSISVRKGTVEKLNDLIDEIANNYDMNLNRSMIIELLINSTNAQKIAKKFN